MEIKLINISLKKEDNIIFDKLNMKINKERIIGIYGNKYKDFINIIVSKDFNYGKIDDDLVLEKVYKLDNYDKFYTSFVYDELFINIDYKQYENDILNILEKFDLNRDFLKRNITTLSNFEKKIIKLIIAIFSTSKSLVICDLFKGIDFSNKKIFFKLIKNLKNASKTIFIYDDIDTLYQLVDDLIIVDNDINIIDKIDDIFDKEEIDSKIELPSFIQLKKLLKEKGIIINNTKDFIKEVKKYV